MTFHRDPRGFRVFGRAFYDDPRPFGFSEAPPIEIQGGSDFSEGFPEGFPGDSVLSEN